MAPWNDEHMGFGLRSKVVESHDCVRLVNELSVEFSGGYATKYAILFLSHASSISWAPILLRSVRRSDTRSDSMPELPEVETVRRILQPGIVGQTIASVTIGSFPGVIASSMEGVDPIASLAGRTFLDTSRRGKYLILHLDDDLYLIVHLRMTGRLLLVPAADPPVRFEYLAIHLDNGLDIRFGDQRKFGRLILSTKDDVDRLDRRLGPEPSASSLTASSLLNVLAKRPGRIKNALLDQRVIAGLGNIYVDEALYRARIHPERPSNSLTVDELKRVLRAIRLVLNQSLERQGTTFSSFENPYGEAGTNADFLRAYGRARDGGRCLRCGTPMERIVVGGRGTTFCPRCQVNRPPPPKDHQESSEASSSNRLPNGSDV